MFIYILGWVCWISVEQSIPVGNLQYIDVGMFWHDCSYWLLLLS